MSRLPQPGLDSGTWGEILNDYLSVTLSGDGTLKGGIVQESHLDTALRAKVAAANGIPADGAITEVKLSPQVQSKLNATVAVASVNNQTGTVTIDKTGVGLGSVDNTSDASKPVSTATQTALNTKAATVHTHAASDIIDATATGRSVVTAADAAAARSAIGAGTSNLIIGTAAGTAKAGDYAPTKSDVGLSNVDNTSDVSKPVSTATQTALNTKAATVHAHIASDITDATATGLSILTAADASAVRTAIGAGAGSSNLVIGTTAGTAKAGDYAPTKADVGLSNVDNTSDVNKPISSAAQTALNLKAASIHTHTTSDLSDATAIGRSVVTAADAAAVRTAIGAGASNLVIGTTAGTAKTGDYAPTKSDVGLSNVDNTSDLSKPVSTATQTALNTKAATVHAHIASDITDATVTGRSVLTSADGAAARTAIGAGTSNLVIGTAAGTAKAGDYAPTKSDVGLSNVDNTSDVNKPVSTATQTALNLKADTASLGAKVLLIDNAAALPAGTPAGIIVVVKS